jgi:ribonucleoside-diphosphate reductase alpha subunit
MQIIKRDKTVVAVDFNKIHSRLLKLSDGLDRIDVSIVATKVISDIFDGISTEQLDHHAVEILNSMITVDPQYYQLAGRLFTSIIHKSTPSLFSECVEANKEQLSDELLEMVGKYKDTLNDAIVTERDYDFDLFGLKTLHKSYLLNNNERPGYMFMRVAIGIHAPDLISVLKTYNDLSCKRYIHATPTLFNAGTKYPQLASCFLLNMEDSIEGIFKTLTDGSLISKRAGGIGINISNIRAKNSMIHGTLGIVPMLRMFDASSTYINQGGKRNGSIAVYMEPYHADIIDFLDLRKNTGSEQLRCRNLFTALWIPDLFMKRVKNNENWSLFSSDTAQNLTNTYGSEFETLYCQYESENRQRETVSAQSIWNAIIMSVVETGTPYLLFKDSINQKSNQKNVGVIQCSNLCAEIVEYTNPDEIAVCNLASINLYSFASVEGYDFDELEQTAYNVCMNLNRIIDLSMYPVPEAQNSNYRHRPIGIGQQGLANVFFKYQLPFDSQEALQLSTKISETIYYGALAASIDLARRDGFYSSYPGSPFSQGKLQFDHWKNPILTKDWDYLKSEMKKFGTRNSLLTAIMPTASTSQILGNIESVEMQTSNVYLRRTQAGEFVVMNEFLVDELIKQKQWNTKTINTLLKSEGDVKDLAIDDASKQVFKTVYETSQRAVIDMAAARGPFVDQSQSMNLFVKQTTVQAITSMIFYGWTMGLKTGMYYLRQKPQGKAIKFTVDNGSNNNTKKNNSCSRKDAQDCIACSG